MNLSEAIRAGTKWDDTRSSYDDGCRVCAIGGALRAELGDRWDRCQASQAIAVCRETWPELNGIKLVCPNHGQVDSDGRKADCSEGGYEELTEKAEGDPFEIASHLFSDHFWSKQVVADWVAKEVESKLTKK